MATVTPPAPRLTHEESRRRVYHPLERLRGTIRLYVALEGLSILLIYLALCFWIGLVLDYGFFKAFTIDWVQELPWGLRASVLGLLVAGLLAVVGFKVVLRLVREFRPVALALVLERRFPDLLGDRLITAVELADPQMARRYGFSQAMIDQTIEDAAARVAEIPISEVFNWQRLRNYGLWVLGLTVGIYVLVGAAYCAVQQKQAVGAFVHRFNDVAAIWFERNVLLANTIWPRRAHLELVRFPDNGDLRISRNSGSAPLQVRALKWVVADSKSPEGWRGLTLADLAKLPGFPDRSAEVALLEGTGHQTVDQLDMLYVNDAARQALDGDSRAALEKVLDDLDQLVEKPEMSRRLRKLEIPEAVTVYYKGDTIRNEMTLTPGGNQEYTGAITDLKETVRFTVNGADYYTPYRTITVVPPPAIVQLERNEERPAYLYHRAPLVGSLEDLKGLKQQMRNMPVSLTGETSRFEVPAGTDIHLTARADKDLKPGKVELLPHTRKGQDGALPVVDLSDAQESLQLDPDGRTFHVTFPKVTGYLDFDFQFEDTDGVIGRRHIVIKGVEDLPPEVDVLVEVVRRMPQGHYLVTPMAKIPFSGKVHDAQGLDRLDYTYSYNALEVEQASQVRAALVAGAAQFSPWSGPLLAPVYLRIVSAEIASAGAAGDDGLQQRPVDGFAARVREKAATDVARDVLAQRLETVPPPDVLIKDFALDPAEEGFDLRRHLPQLQRTDERGLQSRYRIRMWVTAADNNIETGPGVSDSREKFTLMVVSVEELLAEIAKEEESLHVKLEEMMTRQGGVKDAQLSLELMAQAFQKGNLAEKELSAFATATVGLEDTLIRSSDITREVFLDYRRILRELITNRVGEVHPLMITKVQNNICDRLENVLLTEFPAVEEALRELHKSLDARKADPAAVKLALQRMDELIARLNEVLESMGDITNINKLIATIRAIEEGQRQQSEVFKRIKDMIEEDLLQKLLGDPTEKK